MGELYKSEETERDMKGRWGDRKKGKGRQVAECGEGKRTSARKKGTEAERVGGREGGA